MKPLICPNCGGKINRSRMKCEYCGTEFKEEHGELIRFETVPCGTKVFAVNAVVPDEEILYADGEPIMSYVRNELTHKLAEALVPMLDLQVEKDPAHMRHFVRGRIRVVEPGYRF